MDKPLYLVCVEVCANCGGRGLYVCLNEKPTEAKVEEIKDLLSKTATCIRSRVVELRPGADDMALVGTWSGE